MRCNKMRLIVLMPLLWAALTTGGCMGHLAPKSRSPEIERSADFIITTAAAGDTWSSLAATHLKDAGKAWQLAAFNGTERPSAGQRVIIPLVPVVYGGIQKNGYQTVPVLLYTAMAASPSKSRTVSDRGFERQLDYLAANGYVTVSLDAFHGFLELKEQLPPKALVISLDTTDAWAYDSAFAAIKKRGMQAAVFIIPDEVGQKGKLTWSQLAEMSAAGFDVGLYGAKMATPSQEDVKTYLETFEAGLVAPQKTFQRYLKRPCRYYAYPEGESNDLTIAMLKQHGYQLAFTRKRGTNPFFADNFKIKRTLVLGHYELDRLRQNLTTFRTAELE
jgi:peptidoglycan/xylan/chitin deacetylase (PgdA/CDA1 family)